MSKVINLTPVYDRSRVVQDWKCPRSRYWQYEFAGKGVVQSTTSLELFMGIVIHDSLATIALLTKAGKEVDIDAIASTAFTEMYNGLYNPELPADARDFASEQASLVEGLLRGFYRHRWPQLLAQYPKIVMTEQEVSYNHDGLRFMSKPDLILANDDETVYIEYKSTSSKKDSWVNSWATAIQLHSTVRAIKETTGIEVDAVIVQGLFKGYESYGKQSSPFCYAYKRAGHPPFSRDEVAYDYKAGFKRFPVWELKGGVKQWVADMPDIILGDQFPQAPPIYIKDDMVRSFFEQRAIREKAIVDNMDVILSGDLAEDDVEFQLNKTFPQRFDQCTPYFGKPCSYSRLCHGPKVDPIEAGYTWRTPHHEEELERFKELDNEQKD